MGFIGTMAYRDSIVNFYSVLLPKSESFSYVIGSFKDIGELYVRTINEAEVYKFKDKKDPFKTRTYIFRYKIFVSYDVNNIKFKDDTDGKYVVSIPPPKIDGNLINNDATYTHEKDDKNEYGIEIFDEAKFKSFDKKEELIVGKERIITYIQKNKHEIVKESEKCFDKKLKSFLKINNVDGATVEVIYE